MPNILLSCIFAVLDPLITIPASLITRLIDYTRTAHQTSSSEDDPLKECIYRLDSTTPSILTLHDSRKLSYAQFGSTSPTAKTVFFLHGWPGSRIEATYLDKPAQTHNIRVISIDRPGTGSSTPDPKRTLLSHAQDINELAQHLQAETYGIFGVSGGGPYALACALALPPSNLKIVTIICGLGPSNIGYRGMYPANYLGWTYAPHYFPLFTRWWFDCEPQSKLHFSRKQRMNMLRKTLENQRSKIPKKDLDFFGDEDVMKVQVRAAEEVNAQGSKWYMQDMKLLASDMGFDVEDIRKDLMVRLWYGREDRNVPLRHGVEVARRLRSGTGNENGDDGRVSLRIMDDDTHASIFMNHRDEYLGEMAKVL